MANEEEVAVDQSLGSRREERVSLKSLLEQVHLVLVVGEEVASVMAPPRWPCLELTC